MVALVLLACTGIGAIIEAAVGITVASVSAGTLIVLGAAGGAVAGYAAYSSDLWEEMVMPLYSITPETIFANQIPIFNVDFFTDINVSNNGFQGNGNANQIQTITNSLRNVVKKWYNTIRIISIVGMMSVLVYIGIRIILSSSAQDKAKYKEIVKDWLVGMVLLFTMHYIMVFANLMVNSLTELFSSVQPAKQIAAIECNSELLNQLADAGITTTENPDEVKEDNSVVLTYEQDGKKYILWTTDMMGQMRMQSNYNREGKESYIGYTIMYAVMIIYTFAFSWTYIRRVVYMAFLTMIAPLVALTYPIDKINDGTAQGFDIWFKEYIFNLLVQPMHFLLYTVLISSAAKLVTANFIYGLVALGFIATAEKIVRRMFNFSKAETPGILSGPAGAALTFSGIKWLMGHGPKGDIGKSNKADASLSSGDKDLNYTTGSGKISMSNLLGRATTPKSSNISGSSSINIGNSPNAGSSINIRSSGTSIGNSSTTGNLNNITPSIKKNSNSIPYSSNRSNNNRQRRRLNFNPDKALKATTNTAGLYAKGMGKKLVRSIVDAKPIRKVGRLGVGAISGATLGMMGLSAGIASGDPSKALQYTGLAALGGYKLGTGTFDSAENIFNMEELNDEFKRNYYGEEEYQRRNAEKNKKEFKRSEENINKLRKSNNWTRKQATDYLKNDSFVDKCLENNITDINDINDLRKVMENEKRIHTEKRDTGRTEPIMGTRQIERIENRGTPNERKVIENEEYDTGRVKPVYEDVVIEDGNWSEDELIASFNSNRAFFGGSLNTNKDTMDKMKVTLKEREFKDMDDPEFYATEAINRIEGLQKSLNSVKGNI